MRVLGTVRVDEAERSRVRRKAFDMVRALGGDRDLAARAAGEVSDVIRWLQQGTRRPHLTVAVDERSSGAALVLTFGWDDAAEAVAQGGPAPAVLRRSGYRDGTPPVLRYGLRAGASVEACERARRVLTARSREELFASLEASNEALRRSTDEARRAGEAKAQFLANMSHEIRTPMNAIVGMNRLALATDLAPRQRNYLQKIEDSSRHLLAIIDDVLDVSKLDAGKLLLERGDVSLARVLDDVTTLVGGACAEKGLRLSVHVDADVPGLVEGDALRLRQVLVNLATNAVKFTDHGEIEIGVKRVVERGDETVLRFAVRDTGIGLSREQERHLFTSFSQADPTITRRYGGTGLGLAICKSLVELMHGEIGVESALGAGSTFWFRARFGRADGRFAESSLQADLEGRRALVVDDVLAAREILRAALERMGLSVDEAGSGDAALTMVSAGDYDLVFLDWQMPYLDGVETAVRLRSLPLRRRPAVFLTTAYGAALPSASGSHEALDGVLVKPVDPSVLFDTVAGWAAARSGRSQASAAARGAPDGSPGATFDPSSRILMVEDNLLNQEVGTALLAEVGLTATVVGDGRQALDALRREAFDLVLMDLQMPVMDGLSATRAMRQDPDLQDVPVVAMTASALPGDREACLAAGMNDVVTKPIDPPQLWRALAAWLPRRNHATPSPDAAPGASGRGALSLPPAAHPPSSAPTPDDPVMLPRDVPGLDLERGLRMTRGKADLYLDLLRGFVDDQRDLPQLLRHSLDVDDLTTAERLVHTLRGVASMVGARRLSDVGGQLEQALREGEEREVVDRAAAALLDEHTALFSALDQHLSGAAGRLNAESGGTNDGT